MTPPTSAAGTAIARTTTARHAGLVAAEATAPRPAPRGTSYRRLARGPGYQRRLLVLLLAWLTGSMTVHGGGAGVIAIARRAARLDAPGALLLIASFQVVAVVLAQFTRRTWRRPLDEVSP